ncbi:MAG: hypothetical protein WGN25_14940 [Candidatus Electrothrix sp. GW3-4]|uniref:hypothetical protein n=1 Tax=Candidatus Electrothrix sp. GW3-4 TaxID=3126740 RepID=UPI0030CA870D
MIIAKPNFFFEKAIDLNPRLKNRASKSLLVINNNIRKNEEIKRKEKAERLQRLADAQKKKENERRRQYEEKIKRKKERPPDVLEQVSDFGKLFIAGAVVSNVISPPKLFGSSKVDPIVNTKFGII